MLDKIVALLKQADKIVIAGNGGSAAIANHAECDWLKATRFEKEIKSLCANSSVISMIANDYGYEWVFARQLEAMETGVVVLISSSGMSLNVVKAAKYCDENGLTLVTLTGFDGGRLQPYADLCLHVASEDYGDIEDQHQKWMHEISKRLREDN